MKKNPPNPLLEKVWVVVQENEGLITEAFENKRSAITRAKQLMEMRPSIRIDVAEYLIVPNSHKVVNSPAEDEEEG